MARNFSHKTVFSDKRLSTSSRHHESDYFYCEFVGKPLLKEKLFMPSSYFWIWRQYADYMTSPSWGSGGDYKLKNYGWYSIGGRNEEWVAVFLDKPHYVKLGVVTPAFHCCQYNKGITVRVGYSAGPKQPVCGHLGSPLESLRSFYIPCTRIIKGDTITFHVHRKINVWRCPNQGGCFRRSSLTSKKVEQFTSRTINDNFWKPKFEAIAFFKIPIFRETATNLRKKLLKNAITGD